MSERSVSYHGVMVTPETAHALNLDSLLFGVAYLKQDGTRVPAWKRLCFESNPFVSMNDHPDLDPTGERAKLGEMLRVDDTR